MSYFEFLLFRLISSVLSYFVMKIMLRIFPSYQGFNMRIQFDSWSKEFILSVKHESVAKVRLGADALENITRINNLLESYPEKLAEAEQRLETVQEQMTNAKEEVDH